VNTHFPSEPANINALRPASRNAQMQPKLPQPEQPNGLGHSADGLAVKGNPPKA